jgi:hypothetical protein
MEPAGAPPPARVDDGALARITQLEAQVVSLSEDVHELRQLLDQLRRSLGE